MRELAEMVGCHIDTLFRIKGRRNNPSISLAKKLEEMTGIDRRRWLYPDEFGDPWVILYKKHE